MRLIDADALIEELHHMIEGCADLRKDYEYMGIDDCIRSMPTAYDVEKVVQELEEEVEKSTISGMGGISCKIDETKIIDIVERGGVK